MVTDTSERGLERAICEKLSGSRCDPPPVPTAGAPPAGAGGVGWCPGNPHDYDCEYCVDVVQLAAFLRATQPKVAAALDLDDDNPTRRAFLARLHDEINERGVIDLLRAGIGINEHNDIKLFYPPVPGNIGAAEQFARNRFSVSRQLKYNRQSEHSLDVVLFINGLPVFTFELKNTLTGQNADDAERQYKTTRKPNQPLFRLGRCVAHFAMDENAVRFCTHLRGAKSVFLPFDRGDNDGAGNPPGSGFKVAYLWEKILTRDSLADILVNYALLIETAGDKRTQIFPRYHQLDVVRRLLAAVQKDGVGKRYLVQHSAGSGKSNSIAWLAHQLVDLKRDNRAVFDSVIVVSDRCVLDSQIYNTIRQFNQVSAHLEHAESAADLKRFIENKRKIIVSTVQKFPHILSGVGEQLSDRQFAIIIDEAHSGQGGRTTGAINRAITDDDGSDGESAEDAIHKLLKERMDKRKLPKNAAYFAFTATPKSKTLELFGIKQPSGSAGGPRPFHSYTMKQAIQEGFVLDVLANYTPISSYFKLISKAADDPLLEERKATKKLRVLVERHKNTIAKKAAVMVEHFHEQVADKVGGEARAMVVTRGRKQVIDYFYAIRNCLEKRNSRYKALAAFSDEYEYHGKKLTEAKLNQFSSHHIQGEFRYGDYRFLICADKFQTGYDEPLLHTMYVDKPLSGIKTVQTLSRLNRSHPDKTEVFVLDFANSAEAIQEAFQPYYRTTVLSGETDPNKLHNLRAKLDNAGVYSATDIEEFVRLYLSDAPRDQLDAILDVCAAQYHNNLKEEEQVKFKGGAKSFLRAYMFLSCILPYNNIEWEKRSIFLHFLVAKLPAPIEDDSTKGLFKLVNLSGYHTKQQEKRKIVLADSEGTIDPTQPGDEGEVADEEWERLTVILKKFNQQYGDFDWGDKNKTHIEKLITKDIPQKVAADPRYKNARENSDKQNARVECRKALDTIIDDLMDDEEQLYKKYTDDREFQKHLNEWIFELVYPD